MSALDSYILMLQNMEAAEKRGQEEITDEIKTVLEEVEATKLEAS
jgi:hypothetical protein